MRVLFLYFWAYSTVGGIESFNRAFTKALEELCEERSNCFLAASLFDKRSDDRYVSKRNFRGFNGKKLKYVIYSIIYAFAASKIVLGHIHLSPIGLLMMYINRNAKFILIAHGIEVWGDLPWTAKKMLGKMDEILAVSQFTKDELITIHGVDPSKITVFPNTIDPYFDIPRKFDKPQYLLKRYNIEPAEKVILTVSRLFSSEKYKGYDSIIEAIHLMPPSKRGVKYLICGRGDEEEIDRVAKMISRYNLEDSVFLIGAVPEKELTDHYLLSDVFAMPSKGEGFGIVFLEALACGRPVIAGNADGSVDAVMGGELGTLVNPEDLGELTEALLKIIDGEAAAELTDPVRLQTIVLNNFGYEGFKRRLSGINSLFPH